jgi:hypothetical protein
MENRIIDKINKLLKLSQVSSTRMTRGYINA